MRFKLMLLAVLSVLTICGTGISPAFAQESSAPAVEEQAPVVAETPQEEEVSDLDFISEALASYKKISAVLSAEDKTKTAVIITILMALAQLLIQATKTKLFGGLFKKLGDGGKIILVSTCTLIMTAGPLLMVPGISWTEAFFTGGIGSALMVFGHQIYLVVSGKKGQSKTA